MAATLVSFEVSSADKPLLKKCVARALALFGGVDAQSIEMDLSAVHANDTPIDFKKLLDASTEDFVHDLAGIYRHLNRNTGKLEDHFLPRCHR